MTAKVIDAERTELDSRLREVYGDQYEVIKNNRVDRDPRVDELLVAEAIRKCCVLFQFAVQCWCGFLTRYNNFNGGRIMFDPLDLRNLWTPDFDTSEVHTALAAYEAEQQRFRELYGDRGEAMFSAELRRRGEVKKRKWLNCLIYGIGHYPYDATARVTDTERMELDMRLREVYGDQYETIKNNRVECDPRVAELLVSEAIRKGSCEELPDELIAMYHERVGDAV